MRCFLILLLLSGALAGEAQTAASFNLKQDIPLAGVSGKFDHFAFDLTGQRLFAAATGNHSVEVIDLKTGKLAQSLSGLGKPHGLAWVAATGKLYVSDGARGELLVFAGQPFALQGRIKLSDDADDMAYDDKSQLLFVGHGGSDAANPARVAVVDTRTFTLVANIPADAHPEAIELDSQGTRVFANLADANSIAVISIPSKSVIATWKLARAAENVPAAYDSHRNVLYVACRKPGTLIAVDAGTGKELGSIRTVDGADDLFYDPARSRVYVIGGAGSVDIYRAGDAGKLNQLDELKTAPGAKTALFVPSVSELFVGIPGGPGKDASIRIYAASFNSTEKE